MEKLETAVEPKFQEHFVGAMGIPHTNDPFPRLAEAVDLPAPRSSGGNASDRPRRRRRTSGEATEAVDTTEATDTADHPSERSTP